MISEDHPGELKLRRLFAGELAGAQGEALRAHATACAECGSKLRGFSEEQSRFEAKVPFERFAAGVERAARAPRAPARPRWLYPVMGVAAACLVSVSAFSLLQAGQPGFNRTKGGVGIEVVVATGSSGSQRRASPDPLHPEPLSPGDRVRIGYSSGEHRFLTSVSIDEAGGVSALYPEAGPSLPTRGGRETEFLPGSLEFTGRGAERLVVILSDEPLDCEQVKAAARAAYDGARGDLSRIDRLDVPGEQFHRSFLKP